MANEEISNSLNYHQHAWMVNCSYQNPPLCRSITEVKQGVWRYNSRTSNDLRGSEGYQEPA